MTVAEDCSSCEGSRPIPVPQRRGASCEFRALAPPAAVVAWLSRTVGLRQLSLDSCGDVGWLLLVLNALPCQLAIAAAAAAGRWRHAPARAAVTMALLPLLQIPRDICTLSNGISQRGPAVSGPLAEGRCRALSLPLPPEASLTKTNEGQGGGNCKKTMADGLRVHCCCPARPSTAPTMHDHAMRQAATCPQLQRDVNDNIV